MEIGDRWESTLRHKSGIEYSGVEGWRGRATNEGLDWDRKCTSARVKQNKERNGKWRGIRVGILYIFGTYYTIASPRALLQIYLLKRMHRRDEYNRYTRTK